MTQPTVIRTVGGLLSPVSALDALIHGQFSEVLNVEEWAAFKPTLFRLVEEKHRFTLLVELGCGCALPIFFQSTFAKMEDGTTRDLLVSRVAKPNNWDEVCPFRALPQSAAGFPVLSIPLLSWGHGSVEFALRKLQVGED